MNIKRILFWGGFVVVLGLIIWGLIVAMNKPATEGKPASSGEITLADNVQGPLDAQVSLIEYSDFQCPACQTYYYFVKRLLAESTTTIRFAYRHFPLPQHGNAMSASLASEAAGAQGKFWPMYEMLFENHTEWTELANTATVFEGYASKIGLDMTKFRADMSSQVLKDKINDQKNAGIKIGVNATPTFFVNGKAIINPSSYEEFKTIIETAASGSTK